MVGEAEVGSGKAKGRGKRRYNLSQSKEKRNLGRDWIKGFQAWVETSS